MQIRVSFWSGPLHSSTALTSKLQDYKVFFNDSERLVYIYRRDERDYNYDIDKSLKATAIFDQVKQFFEPKSGEVVSFDELPVRDAEVTE
jgi:hypothetical protein